MAFEKSFLISVKNIDLNTSFHICKSVNKVLITLNSVLNSSNAENIIIRCSFSKGLTHKKSSKGGFNAGN